MPRSSMTSWRLFAPAHKQNGRDGGQPSLFSRLTVLQQVHDRYLIGHPLFHPIICCLVVDPALDPAVNGESVPYGKLRRGQSQLSPGDGRQVIRPAVAPGHRQHQVADAAAQGRAAEHRGLADAAAQGNAVAGGAFCGGDLQGIDGEHQAVAHAGAVIEGAQLPPQQKGPAHRHQPQLLLRQHHRKGVRLSGEPRYLQIEAVEGGGVVVVGPCGGGDGSAFQDQFVSCGHVVHLVIVMVEHMRKIYI